MITLDNISFKDYISLENRSEYEYAINFAFVFQEPKDIFSVGDFTQLEYGLIKDLQYDMGNGILWDKMLEYMAKLSSKDINYFYDLPLLSVIQFKNYIVSQINFILMIEEKQLGHEPTDEELRAGINELNVFGIYNQFLSVALGDPLKIPQVKQMKYEDAFVFLCAQKANNEFERRLIEIRQKPTQ